MSESLTPSLKTSPLGNFEALDALRGLLAVYVIAGHARWLLWTGHSSWVQGTHSSIANGLAFASAGLRYGHEAVMVFFALSGFFIHQRMAKSTTREMNVGEYARRRSHRIVPPYLMALAVTLIVDSVGRYCYPQLYLAQTGDAMLDANFARKSFSTLAVLPAMVGLPSAFDKDFGSNGPLWSIGYEIVYYVLYPLWLGLRRVSWKLAYVLFPLALFIMAPSIPNGYLAAVLLKYPIWIAGAALAEIAVTPQLRRIPVLAAGILGLLALGILGQFVPLIHLAIGTGIVAIFGCLPRSVSSWQLSRCFEFIGIRSYSLYACHFPVLVIISAWVFETQGVRPTSGTIAVMGTLIAIGTGLVCFSLCERRFLHRPITLPIPLPTQTDNVKRDAA